MIEQIVQAYDDVLMRLMSKFGAGTYDYCQLVAPAGKHALFTKKGEVVSLIEIDGIHEDMGAELLLQRTDMLASELSPLIQDGHTRFQVVQTHNPEGGWYEIQVHLDGYHSIARNLRLDPELFSTLLKQQQDVLAPEIISNRTYLAVFTLPGIISSYRHEVIKKEREEAAKEGRLPASFGRFALPTVYGIEDMKSHHSGNLSAVLSILQTLGLSHRLLDKEEVVRALRLIFDPESTHPDWMPLLPDGGDDDDTKQVRIPVRAQSQGPHSDADNLYFPSIALQVAGRHTTTNDALVKIGRIWYGGLTMELSPQSRKPFSELAARINNSPRRINWRVSFSLRGGTNTLLGKLRTRRTIARIMRTVNNLHNTSIINALDELMDHISATGDIPVGLQMTLVVHDRDPEACMENLQEVARLVQTWGNCDVMIEEGAPLEPVWGSLPTQDMVSPASMLIEPLRDTTILLPMFANASPWDHGGCLFYTRERRLFPFQPASNLQEQWNTIIIGSPGSGKSVMISTLHWGAIMTRGLSDLPYICHLDIGPSQYGFIKTLQSLLPENRRHEAQYHEVVNEPGTRFAKNPFDTMLGARRPTQEHKQFLKAFLTLLLTPEDTERPMELLGELVSMLIEEAYRLSTAEPQPYAKGAEPVVDEFLLAYGEIKPQGKRLTWWEIVDAAMRAGRYDIAERAQVHAVPRISTLSGVIASSPSIRSQFGDNRTEKVRNLMSTVNTMLQSASSQYPIFCEVSKFRTEGARIQVFDLEKVATGDTKTRALMYMWAKHAAAGEFYQRPESLNQLDASALNAKAREYHDHRLQALAQHMKFITADEFHVVENVDIVQRNFDYDAAVARKYGIALTIGTQSIDSVPERISKDLMSTLMVLKLASAEAADQVAAKYNLSAKSREILRHEVRGPGKRGASFFLHAKIKGQAPISQLLYSKLNPMMLVAWTTHHADRQFRRILEQKMGYTMMLRLLSVHLQSSGGSIAPLLEKYKQEHADADEERFINQKVEELLMEYRSILREKLDAA